MSDFVTLSCPSCGGKLQITSDIERFACVHCNTEHIVKRGSGIVSLAPVMETLAKVQSGVDILAKDVEERRQKEKLQFERVDLQVIKENLELKIAEVQTKIRKIVGEKEKKENPKFQAYLYLSLGLAIFFAGILLSPSYQISTLGTGICGGMLIFVGVIFFIETRVLNRLQIELSSKEDEANRNQAKLDNVNQQLRDLHVQV
jgi:hypothetical protein